MKITQGTFAYLADLTDDEVEAQLRYVISNGCAVSIELTDDPHPRNVYWEMWGLPMFDLADPAGVMTELRACRAAFPHHYVRINAFDASAGR
ncbi:MAG TPA: ribulose bisphosphate carboxylase small subunit, partial [Acidimicrobiales bacterium]|nr:ribulose bisphosphate carboxylase small subunit [Acidimicrobiales bacterium]